jgi:hypothetical protein
MTHNGHNDGLMLDKTLAASYDVVPDCGGIL